MLKSWVYILTNTHHTTFYVGVTSDLYARLSDHKNHIREKAFTTKYAIHKLVYYETFDSIIKAIAREKALKGKKRAYKINLINTFNPHWHNLPAPSC